MLAKLSTWGQGPLSNPLAQVLHPAPGARFSACSGERDLAPRGESRTTEPLCFGREALGLALTEQRQNEDQRNGYGGAQRDLEPSGNTPLLHCCVPVGAGAPPTGAGKRPGVEPLPGFDGTSRQPALLGASRLFALPLSA